MCSVRAFGARGDNATEDTAAIAAAIAHCAAVGGAVLLPAPGVYLSRPLTIGDGAHLIIERGATLLAWGDLRSWPNTTLDPPFRGQQHVGESFITLVGAGINGTHGCSTGRLFSNVVIEGGGTIDAQGWRWWPHAAVPAAQGGLYLRPRTLQVRPGPALVSPFIPLQKTVLMHVSADASSSTA